ncbi:MAG: hypothetical protein CMH64_04640 [Nanoarchaeota archaeon]|nr:hypothetical protein [Nanoarchaeota archaeon]|tara:strand:- start:885 stop:1727 length:843 start_codon:yes stop_codon:yes gene_type:complete
MPVNPDIHYQKAEEDYHNANTDEEKINALKKMLSLAPSHKGAEILRKNIKTKIAKLRFSTTKQKELKKGGFQKISFKKEGAASVALLGVTNSGKSTLLKELTNANVKIASYEFTTKKPEYGILDYQGVKIQIIEIPAVVKNFLETELGPSLFSIIETCDLILLLFNDPSEKNLLDRELSTLKIKKIIYIEKEDIKEKIWKNLNLIKVYTKEPGKEKAYPPVALDKKSNVRDLGVKVHKDFIKKFKYSVVNGPSGKFKNQRVGLKHILKDDDIVEFHIEKN